MSTQKTLDEAKYTVIRVTVSTREKVVRREECEKPTSDHWTIEIHLAGTLPPRPDKDDSCDEDDRAQLRSLQLPRST